MATLKEYFETDFHGDVTAAHKLTVRSSANVADLEITARVHFDFNSNSKFASYYIPSSPHLPQLCVALLHDLEPTFFITGAVHVQLPLASQFFGGLQVVNSVPVSIHAIPLCESAIDSSALPFSNTVFIYSQDTLSACDLSNVKLEAKKRNILLRFRGPDYAEERAKMEKPLAFISHDSRDKDQIARPLAMELSKRLCPVWYDEYSLKVGDRLRESIEKGLKECKKCVLILSPNFLTNEGWTKVEFNSIFTREIVEAKDFVLPVWCGITKKDLFEYCPTLVDRYGANWDSGVEEVARRVHAAIL